MKKTPNNSTTKHQQMLITSVSMEGRVNSYIYQKVEEALEILKVRQTRQKYKKIKKRPIDPFIHFLSLIIRALSSEALPLPHHLPIPHPGGVLVMSE